VCDRLFWFVRYRGRAQLEAGKTMTEGFIV